MGVFKQREITGFKGFQSFSPITFVTTQLSLAKTRPNGTFRRFIRSHEAFRTALSSHRGGR
jgi:hypothetical protein